MKKYDIRKNLVVDREVHLLEDIDFDGSIFFLGSTARIVSDGHRITIAGEVQVLSGLRQLSSIISEGIKLDWTTELTDVEMNRYFCANKSHTIPDDLYSITSDEIDDALDNLFGDADDEPDDGSSTSTTASPWYALPTPAKKPLVDPWGVPIGNNSFRPDQERKVVRKAEPDSSTDSERRKAGVCVKCGNRGEWIAMVLKCPKHGKIIG